MVPGRSEQAQIKFSAVNVFFGEEGGTELCAGGVHTVSQAAETQ